MWCMVHADEDMNGRSGEILELSSSGNDDQERSDRGQLVYVDDVLTDIGCGPFQIIAFFLAGLSTFSYGGTATVLGFVSIPVTTLWDLSALTYSIAIAVTSLTNMLGSMVFGLLANRFGRVWPFALCKSIVGVLSFAAAFSPAFFVFVILRGLASFGTGGAQALTYPMLVEFLPIKNRGKSVLLMLMFSLGSCLIAGLAWWLVPTYKDGWRYLLVASSIPPLLSSAFRIIFYFQSPRFLISRGETTAAWKMFKVMAKLNGKKLDDTKKEHLTIEEEKRVTNGLCKQFIYLFKPPLLSQTIILLVIIFLSRYCFYSTLIFLPVILKNFDVHVVIYFSLMIAAIAQIPGILLMTIITEWPWFGRLNTLRLYSLTAAVLFFLFAFIRNEIATPVFIVLIFFTMCPIVSMSYTYATEIYPTEVRTIALGTLVSIQGMVGIPARILTGFITDQTHEFPWLYQVLWGAMYLVILLVSYGLKKETRGERLEDILKRD